MGRSLASLLGGATQAARVAPAPGLLRIRDGRITPYGSPGGGTQPQAMVQFLVNLVAAVSQLQLPLVVEPTPLRARVVRIESRALQPAIDELGRRGHLLEMWPEWTASPDRWAP